MIEEFNGMRVNEKFNEIRLRKAIKHKEFMPFYQPIVDIYEHRVVGCEILVRWLEPVSGVINASAFIESIEKHDLLIDMTECLVNDLFKDIKESDRKLRSDFFITLNVNPEMLLNDNSEELFKWIKENAKKNNVKITLEITERTSILQNDKILNKLRELSNSGFSMAVDDYGTGYSSEVLFATSKPKYIKTDAKILQENNKTLTCNFLHETTRIATMIGASVIAEGVETKEHEEILKQYGIRFAQGYRYGPAMPFRLFCYQSNPWEEKVNKESMSLKFE